MGKYAYVECNCPNRQPLPGSERGNSPASKFRRTHVSRQKRKHAEQQWTTNEGMYACGHRNGILIELWPGDLYDICHCASNIFVDESDLYRVSRKIVDGNYWDGDCRSPLSVEDATGWRVELERLQRYFDGRDYMGWDRLAKWKDHFERHPILNGDELTSIADGIRLCEASCNTGNPILFGW